MNEFNVDAILDAWLDLGPTSAPNRVAEAVRLEVRATHQTAIRKWWAPRRFPDTNNRLRLAVAAVAVVAIAALGYGLMQAGTIGQGPSEAPSPSGAPSPSQVPSPSAGQTAAAHFPVFPGPPRPVDAGIYDLGPDSPGPDLPVSVTFVVPAGWLSCANNAGFLCPDDGVGGVNIFSVTNVVEDPCDETTPRDTSVGPTVDDLVTAISSLPWAAITPPTDVIVDGFRGKEFEVTAPARSPCVGTDDFAAWVPAFMDGEGADSVSPGERNRLRILDIHGTRVVIAGSYLPGTTSLQDLAEINAIIDSVRFEP